MKTPLCYLHQVVVEASMVVVVVVDTVRVEQARSMDQLIKLAGRWLCGGEALKLHAQLQQQQQQRQ